MKPEHQAASGLDSFPAEILYLVVQLLSSAERHALCLVNKRFRIIAEPFLYAQIQWTWTNSQNPPVAQFLRSIVRRPELASFVHVLILNGDSFDLSWHNYKQKSPKLPVTEVVLDGLEKCIKKIRIPYAEQWIQELRAGTMDAFITLLLSQLPSLRRLYLGKNFARESRLMGMMLRSALCEEFPNSHLPSFTHLQDVSAVYPDLGLNIRKYTDVRNTADALPLFYLPSVERIKALIDNPATFIWPGKYLPNPSRLASLDLTMLREGHLGQVLSVTQGLRKLQWDWYYRPDLEDHFVTDIIDLDQIAADLSHVQETLTDLTITAGSDVSQADPELPEVTFRGSFKTFSGLHMLKNLEVPIAFLLGFSPSTPNVVGLEEALPESIEWLTITDDLCLQREWEWFEIEYLLRAVRSWLQDWKRFTPRLRGFGLLSRIHEMVEDRELIEGLRDIGSQAGIQFQIIKNELK
ncbi:hypothetical protein Asppvi_006957 [Aspergillus pseudoviridinutans]|uniref:F-box domain-containing protein n=1 Tax=Aspergillus pseudoviridinutans TaxID=1517512 RepID=A0A9P3BHX9_9EURO|nr:uncharacterized protein Asppvi_006957 [Aspergillus pseudoviridinutans]GIJ88041.1 hypothetical protein Asppvi_006957 [Aspergillus pseudoviridinutans]